MVKGEELTVRIDSDPTMVPRWTFRDMPAIWQANRLFKSYTGDPDQGDAPDDQPSEDVDPPIHSDSAFHRRNAH